MSGTADFHLVDWLLENAGPVIRYRTATELADCVSHVHLRRLEQQLVASPIVGMWLGHLKPGRIHNSKDTDFENAMGKLLEFGFRAGMSAFDKKTAPFRQELATILNAPPGMMRTLNAVIVAAGLLRAGYKHEITVDHFLLGRLDALYCTIQKAGYNIYVNAEAYEGIPELWRRKKVPLINPQFSPDGEFLLPYIHDIYALSRLPEYLRTVAATKKINAIIRYALAPGYQALPPGYGLLRVCRRNYCMVGWSVDLPRCQGPRLHDREAKILVQRVELMAHFSAARKHDWFRNALRHLERFRTTRGTYRFPRSYLQEVKDGYWVSGAHMGLEEDRRSPKSIEVESTFRMLKIRRLIAGDSRTIH